MKKISIISLVAAVLIIANSALVSAQFVGDASPAQTVTPSGKKPGYAILKFGTAMPSSDNKIIPNMTSDLAGGKLGMKNGFFAEIGYGLDIIGGKSKAGFYYAPIMLAYYQTQVNFGSGYESAKRPFSAIEVAQRYGVFYKPIEDVLVAGYYRPAGIIPLGFKFNDNLYAEMSTAKGAPVFMMSHTFGFTAQYKFIAVSYEHYKAQPTLDFTADESTTTLEKIPLRMNILSFAFVF